MNISQSVSSLSSSASSWSSSSSSNSTFFTNNQQLQQQPKRPITGLHNFAQNKRKGFSAQPHQTIVNPIAIYSRKVFVGGLPPDIDEGNLKFFENIFTFSNLIIFFCSFKMKQLNNLIAMVTYQLTGHINQNQNQNSHQKATYFLSSKKNEVSRT